MLILNFLKGELKGFCLLGSWTEDFLFLLKVTILLLLLLFFFLFVFWSFYFVLEYSGKEPASQCRRCRRHGFHPWVGKIPYRRKWQPTPVFLPGKFHGQQNLVGYSPWGHKELTQVSNWARTLGIPNSQCCDGFRRTAKLHPLLCSPCLGEWV